MSRSCTRIRELNDAFRKSLRGGKLMITSGLRAEGEDFINRAIEEVRAFDGFTPENDPHLEHDFGSFEIEGEKLFWKIDYYDAKMEYGSEDPANPNQTTRVLTIMLASEY